MGDKEGRKKIKFRAVNTRHQPPQARSEHFRVDLPTISLAWPRATRLKERISLQKEVSARVLGTTLPFLPGFLQGKVKERSGFWRNWARQRVPAALGEEQGQSFLPSKDNSHQPCTAPVAQMSFLKKHRRNELKPHPRAQGRPRSPRRRVRGNGRTPWHLPHPLACGPHEMPGWLFLPPALYLPPVLLPHRGASSEKGRKEGGGES